jgi:hypothetical protein
MVWSSERQWLADPKVEDDQIGSHMSVVKGKDRGRAESSVHMVWRGKRSEKISKFSKGVQNPKNFTCPRSYFERLANRELYGMRCANLRSNFEIPSPCVYGEARLQMANGKD